MDSKSSWTPPNISIPGLCRSGAYWSSTSCRIPSTLWLQLFLRKPTRNWLKAKLLISGKTNFAQRLPSYHHLGFFWPHTSLSVTPTESGHLQVTSLMRSLRLGFNCFFSVTSTPVVQKQDTGLKIIPYKRKTSLNLLEAEEPSFLQYYNQLFIPPPIFKTSENSSRLFSSTRSDPCCSDFWK